MAAERNIIAKTLAQFLKEQGRAVPESLQRVLDRDAAEFDGFNEEQACDCRDH